MNDFLVKNGLSQSYGETWVVVPNPGSPKIIAYYTVAPDPVELGGDDDEDADAIVIQLERLAVDVSYQKQGLGETLLVRLIVQMLSLPPETKVKALNLTALDEDAKDWYLRRDFGFEELTAGSSYLTLPMDTIRLIFGKENTTDQP